MNLLLPIPSNQRLSAWRVERSPRSGFIGLRAYSPDGNFCAEVEQGEAAGVVHVSFSECGISAGPADADMWIDALQVASELVRRLKD